MAQRSVDPNRVVAELTKTVAQQALVIAQLNAYIAEKEEAEAT